MMEPRHEVVDGIGTLVLSGGRANALRGPALADPAVLEAFFEREEVKGAVLTCSGRHFCAGADLEELARSLADETSLAELGSGLEVGKAALEAIAFAPVPVVAAVRGSCLGAGLEIALAAHFRVASRNALLGLPESGLGLIPGLGGTARAAELLPRRVAVDLVLSGRMISAGEALELGLVDRVVATSELEGAARQLLVELVGRRSKGVVRAVMTALHNARRLPREDALREEGRLFLEVARAASRAGLEGGEPR